MVFESIMKWHTKKLIVFGVGFGMVIGVCFSYLHFEAVTPNLSVIGGYFSAFDASLNDIIGKSYAPAADGIFSFINVIAFRIYL